MMRNFNAIHPDHGFSSTQNHPTQYSTSHHLHHENKSIAKKEWKFANWESSPNYQQQYGSYLRRIDKITQSTFNKLTNANTATTSLMRKQRPTVLHLASLFLCCIFLLHSGLSFEYIPCHGVFSLMVVAASSPSQKCFSSGITPLPSATTITLIHNNWLGSTVNNEVARIILEEKLGYKVAYSPEVGVEDGLKIMSTNNNVPYVLLEFWRKSRSDLYDQYVIQSNAISDVGDLGVNGQIVSCQM